MRRRINLLKEVWRVARAAADALELPREDPARRVEMVLHAKVLEMTAARVRRDIIRRIQRALGAEHRQLATFGNNELPGSVTGRLAADMVSPISCTTAVT